MSEKYLVDCIHTIICRNLYNGKCIAVQCEAYMAPSGWISVKDRLPKKDGRYIVYDSHGQDVTEMHFITGDYDNSGWYVSAYHKADTGQITHWQPLPSPPEGK